MNILGIKIKEFRSSRDWTQNELAKRSGVDRATLASIESSKAKHPTTANLLKLARAFNIRPEELYHAAGYLEDGKPYQIQRPETSEEILERLRIAHPATIPVYTSYPSERSKWYDMIAYIYRDRKESKKSLEAYVIRAGKPIFEPEIKDEDVIIVDREGEIDNGDIVACLVDGMLQLGRLRKIGGDLWFENNGPRIKFEECQVAALVIEVIRRLK